MEPEKSVVSSSPENDQTRSTADSAGVGRSYECNFCKRGFTNAQALGGHMNIHRKEKGKGKIKPRSNYNNHGDQDQPTVRSNYGSLRYLPGISNLGDEQRLSYYSHGEGREMEFKIYLPLTNPNSQTGNYGSLSKGVVDAELSLRIGDGDRGGNVKENEVDLELRLGHERRP